MNKTCTLFFSLCMASTAALSQNLGTIESVEFDAEQHRFLVSNANNIVVVDGNGDPVSYFGAGPVADYGMEVMNGILYTIANNQIYGYELTAGLQQMEVAIPGVVFLNGMASDGANRLWVTDFSAKKIYQIDVTDVLNPVVTLLVANTTTTPNGIVYDGANNRLVFVNWGSNAKIKAVDLTNGAVSDLTTTSLGNCDGIDKDGQGNWFVSSWLPSAKITKFTNDFSTSATVTVSGMLAPADIAYANEIDTLIIPSTTNSRVLFVGFSNTSDVLEYVEEQGALKCFPNPAENYATLEFSLKQNDFVTVEIVDVTGAVVQKVINENLPAGEQKIVFPTWDFASGVYICRASGKGWQHSVPLVH
jgi:hypothetical protein